MKVLFLVATKGHGRGGHFYSLKTTVEQMAQDTKVAVLNIGTQSSPVIDGLGDMLTFLECRGLLGTLSRAISHIQSLKPDVIHAFDFESFFFARIASWATKIPLVLTKCGGPNPTRYYPAVESLVLYSAENETFFKEQKKYASTRTHLIPNRVSIPKQDAVRIAALKAFLKPNLPVFLRIARISKAYRNSLLQTINLVKRLNADGLRVQLLIVGTVQDKEVLEELLAHADETTRLITEDRFTANASELIDIADFVVGTGRGFVEAALLGKAMLSPNSNLDIPVAATEKNIDAIASLNFSERPAVSASAGEAFGDIVKILDDKHNRTKTAQFTKQYAIDNFLADRISEKYLPVYQEARCARMRPVDLLIHGYLTWKAFSRAERKGVVA